MIQFPKNFVWGSATSSYQIEGAWNKDGKGLSIWDAFCHTPGRVYGQHTADIACDHYHKYKEDIALMAKMGLKAYRFSISWPRIQPDGKGNINPEGIRFYSNLIDELLAHDIDPWITLYHWDLPLALQLENDGWLDPNIPDYFTRYAEICFEHFGDRVKNWITLNEPWVVAILGYGNGEFAPGRVSDSEPYIAAHHLILAHAKAAENYRNNFKESQKGKIGITNNCDWREPLTQSTRDQAAAQRALEFFLAWFTDPIYLGDYPEIMKTRVGPRLPRFTDEEKALIKGSSEFFGLNHYTTLLASDATEGEEILIEANGNGGLSEDQYVNLTIDPDWIMTDMNWPLVSWGCEKLLYWIKERYGNPPIYITENGCALREELVDGKVKDPIRVKYFSEYLSACHQAIQNGVNLKGYFAWSLMDNFEWAKGYSKRFGLHYVDYNTLKRIPKSSAYWYSDTIKNNGF